uniref:Uncharacterized protein n=1 Tax=Anopheles merus TaxID=30066 RepID=A0A182UTK2_ANOME
MTALLSTLLRNGLQRTGQHRYGRFEHLLQMLRYRRHQLSNTWISPSDPRHLKISYSSVFSKRKSLGRFIVMVIGWDVSSRIVDRISKLTGSVSGNRSPARGSFWS